MYLELGQESLWRGLSLPSGLIMNSLKTIPVFLLYWTSYGSWGWVGLVSRDTLQLLEKSIYRLG